MAVRIASAESIRRAILADALLSSIIGKVDINRTALPAISVDPAAAILELPEIDDFEAVWFLRIIGLTLEEISEVSNALHSIFSSLEINPGVSGIEARIRSLATEQIKNIVKLEEDAIKEQAKNKAFEDALNYATSLTSGKDGARGEKGEQGPVGPQGERGPMGPAGRDGKDLIATEAFLNDLKDVFVPDPKVGHVLTWDGVSWVPLFVPQVYKYASGGTGGGFEDAPADGNFYVRKDNEWISLADAIFALTHLDAGNFDTGLADSASIPNDVDGGFFD